MLAEMRDSGAGICSTRYLTTSKWPLSAAKMSAAPFLPSAGILKFSIRSLTVSNRPLCAEIAKTKSFSTCKGKGCACRASSIR